MKGPFKVLPNSWVVSFQNALSYPSIHRVSSDYCRTHLQYVWPWCFTLTRPVLTPPISLAIRLCWPHIRFGLFIYASRYLPRSTQVDFAQPSKKLSDLFISRTNHELILFFLPQQLTCAHFYVEFNFVRINTWSPQPSWEVWWLCVCSPYG